MADHTPTPWQVFPKTGITERAGIDQVDGISIVCIGCSDDDAGIHGATPAEAAANAAFIVKAVNSHDVLMKAIEEVAYPIKAMEFRLKPDEKIDGVMAVALANNAEYLRSIALKALAALQEAGR